MTPYQTKLALLGGTIDFAGMFPPASLTLEGTLSKAATFRRTAKHPWLMNKVVLALGEFKRLSVRSLYEAGADGSPWIFSLLASPLAGDSTDDFLKAVDWDIREMRRFQERFFYSSCRQDILGYEIKLPEVIQEPGQAITSGEYIFPALEKIESVWPGRLDVFFEISLEKNLEETLEGVSRILVEWLSECGDSALIGGLKVRTGGKYLPKASELALCIETCAWQGLRLKFTQGMHSPISHDGQFGFVNVYAALAFAYGLGTDAFPRQEIEACLLASEAKTFTFGEGTLEWNGHSLTLDQIESARRVHCSTFGSCSLDEPDQFLAKEFP